MHTDAQQVAWRHAQQSNLQHTRGSTCELDCSLHGAYPRMVSASCNHNVAPTASESSSMLKDGWWWGVASASGAVAPTNMKQPGFLLRKYAKSSPPIVMISFPVRTPASPTTFTDAARTSAVSAVELMVAGLRMRRDVISRAHVSRTRGQQAAGISIFEQILGVVEFLLPDNIVTDQPQFTSSHLTHALARIASDTLTVMRSTDRRTFIWTSVLNERVVPCITTLPHKTLNVDPQPHVSLPSSFSIFPIETTAASSGSISRATIVCSATETCAAQSMASTDKCGMAPWPPLPWIEMRNLSVAAIKGPATVAMGQMEPQTARLRWSVYRKWHARHPGRKAKCRERHETEAGAEGRGG